MGQPHKHAEVIKAWADGAEIQYKVRNSWVDADRRPAWHPEGEYRVKPKEVKLVPYYRVVYLDPYNLLRESSILVKCSKEFIDEVPTNWKFIGMNFVGNYPEDLNELDSNGS